MLVVSEVDGDEDPSGRDCSNLTPLILCIGSEGKGKKGKGKERKGRETSPPNLWRLLARSMAMRTAVM